MQYKRILVLGYLGSGKSAFALKLGAVLHLPVVHLDKLFWSREGVAKSAYAFRSLLEDALAKDAWIMVGNYSGTMTMRLERCELVIYFGLPWYVSLFGFLKRICTAIGIPRADKGDDSPERLDRDFLKHIWSFKKDDAARDKNMIKSSSKPVMWLRSRRDARRFFKDLDHENS